VTSTMDRYYTDSSDNPAWITTDPDGAGLTPATTTRYATSLAGDLGAAINEDGTAELTIANAHGDAVTTIDIPANQPEATPATALSGWADYTEYGTPRDPADTTSVAGTAGYGWLGAKQRSKTNETAGLTLMVRCPIPSGFDVQ
jgi:large repetitive protein